MRFVRRPRNIEGEEGLSRGISHSFLVLGLLLTTLFAVLEQANARQEREILFDAASTHIQEDLVNAVDTRVQDFQTAINFISATHPGPLDEYQAFFSEEFEAVMANDPGMVFLESVPADGTEALLAREHALGNDEFTVTLLPGNNVDRVILTRLARDAEVFDLPLLGLDITPLQHQLLPENLGPTGFELLIRPAQELTTFVSPENLVDERYAEYDGFVAFLVGPVNDAGGDFIGYSIHFETVLGLLENVTAQDLDELSVELHVIGIDSPVAGRQSPDAPDLEVAPLRASREVTTTSLQWRIDVWADADFGPPTGLFDQTWVWIIGTLATAGAYAASVRRQRNRLRLYTARFELAHARTLAQTDALTGLLNRNGLVETAREFPTDTAATVFFIDLDGFKAVNDSGGHALGDQVLRAVAAELATIFRAEDLVSRLGGDEFVVFTEHCGSSDYVTAVSARITKTISEIDERVTCSLGVASRLDGEMVDVKDLVRAADSAMYEAKRSGGNRFTVGTGPTAGSDGPA
ncbi:MAG: diguanylate cyclase [Acidimicrobiales bacterium]